MNTTPTNNQPVILTIAGSDCSSGAGIQADMKAAAALDVFTLTAVTCVVSEIPGHVSRIQEVAPDIVSDQIELLLQSFPVGAIKTGMLYSPEIVRRVADILRDYKLPLVIDPVMIASSGDSLIQQETITALEEHLLPLATLVTPNMDEASVLTKTPLHSLEDNTSAALELARRYNLSFLLKGGHLNYGTTRTDILALPSGQLHQWTGDWYDNVSTHGTGCTYSAAIAAELAKGLPLPDAIGQAHHLVAQSIKNHYRWALPQEIDALNPTSLNQ